MFFRSLLLSLPLVALLAGCGPNIGGVSVEFDDALETELRTLVRTDGATKPLAELFPGDWDTVHVILGPKTEKQIENEIGRPVTLKDGTYGDTFMQNGNMLVFIKSGEIVRMVSTGQLAVVPTGVFTSDAIVYSDDGAIRILSARVTNRPTPDSPAEVNRPTGSLSTVITTGTMTAIVMSIIAAV